MKAQPKWPKLHVLLVFMLRALPPRRGDLELLFGRGDLELLFGRGDLELLFGRGDAEPVRSFVLAPLCFLGLFAASGCSSAVFAVGGG